MLGHRAFYVNFILYVLLFCFLCICLAGTWHLPSNSLASPWHLVFFLPQVLFLHPTYSFQPGTPLLLAVQLFITPIIALGRKVKTTSPLHIIKQMQYIFIKLNKYSATILHHFIHSFSSLPTFSRTPHPVPHCVSHFILVCSSKSLLQVL